MLTLDELIKIHVMKALTDCNTRVEAAKKLGISIRTLRNYMTRWGCQKKLVQSQRDYEKEVEPKIKEIKVRCYRSITPEERDKFESMDRY